MKLLESTQALLGFHQWLLERVAVDLANKAPEKKQPVWWNPVDGPPFFVHPLCLGYGNGLGIQKPLRSTGE